MLMTQASPFAPRETIDERERLLREIEAEDRDVAKWTGSPPLARRVIDAIARVPREQFVPPGEVTYAYLNVPLPIGFGQTISQPYVVAYMSNIVDVGETSVVLEVGTGSGYQAAVLAELVRFVYSVEAIPELAEAAAARLARLGYANVEVRQGDGHDGWPEHAPFDAIVVTAAAASVPPALLDQLRPGGRMIIPVDSFGGGQDLILIEKDACGRHRQRAVLPVAFVPLVRVARSDGRQA